MIRRITYTLFRYELEKPISINRKFKDEFVYNNFTKKKLNETESNSKLQNKDDIKYYNQNFKIKSEVNWNKEW